MRHVTRDDLEAQIRAAMRADDWPRVAGLATILDGMGSDPRPVGVLGAALWYAQVGLRVFPIQPYSKLPFKGTRGCKDATDDPERIRAWWHATPSANLAIATGYGVDVIDFDGALGHEAWSLAFPADPDDNTAAWGGMQVLATVSTPRPGGLHAYVRATGQGNRAGMVPGVDYRGQGGYVLVPPSTTPQGHYRFLRPLNPEDIRP